MGGRGKKKEKGERQFYFVVMSVFGMDVLCLSTQPRKGVCWLLCEGVRVRGWDGVGEWNMNCKVWRREWERETARRDGDTRRRSEMVRVRVWVWCQKWPLKYRRELVARSFVSQRDTCTEQNRTSVSKLESH